MKYGKRVIMVHGEGTEDTVRLTKPVALAVAAEDRSHDDFMAQHFPAVAAQGTEREQSLDARFSTDPAKRRGASIERYS